MHETELGDLSDDADYAASMQQGSASNSRGDSSRRSGPLELSGAEVVYVKDNVAIHPTQYASERISGRLRLIKQATSLFMSWIPYKANPRGFDSTGLGQSSQSRIPEKDRNLYSIRAVSFTEIRSIRRHTPTLGWQYIIVVLASGLAFPPLYFYNGGVREFLATIKQHVLLARSADDADVFLVNDLQDPLQRSLSSLELPRVVPVSNGTPPLSPFSSDENYGSISETVSYSGHPHHKVHDPARDISIQVLEKFSLVTKFARDTTSHIFGEIHNDAFSGNHRKPQIQPAPVIRDNENFDTKQESLDSVPVTADPFEVDKISLVWGKPRQPPLGFDEWTIFLDSEGRITDSDSLRKRIFYGGVEHGLRKEVWKFLLGSHAYDSTYAEREYLSVTKKLEYETIKSQWKSISAEQSKRFTKFRERRGLIEKDVVRTDRSISFYDGDDNPNVALLHDILLTYSFYNFDLGYCQAAEEAEQAANATKIPEANEKSSAGDVSVSPSSNALSSAPLVTPPTSTVDSAVIPPSLRMQRVYLRSNALDQMIQAASSSAGLRTMKRVEQTLQELVCHVKPKVPTKAVCAEHVELRKEILTLLNLQKQLQYKEAEASGRDPGYVETPGTPKRSLRGDQDRAFIPDSVSFGGERSGKRDQKRKAPGRYLDTPPSPPQSKRPRKLKTADG